MAINFKKKKKTNVPNNLSFLGDCNGVSFTACSEGVCMIDNRPGSVEDNNGDDKDATSIDSGNHLGLVAAIDKGAM